MNIHRHGVRLHGRDQKRLIEGKLKIVQIRDLTTGRQVQGLDPIERVRAECNSFDDMLYLIKERASCFNWYNDEKILSTLWKQVQSGETIFSINGNSAHSKPLIRDVDAVNVQVCFETANGVCLQLVEESVKFDNETESRHRAYPYISGKGVLGEFSHQTAHRELQEETGIHCNPNLIQPCGLRKVSRSSPLFPGIKSVYWFRLFQLTINSGAFKPQGYETYKDGVRSKFIWIPQEEVPSWVANRQASTTVRDEIFPDW